MRMLSTTKKENVNKLRKNLVRNQKRDFFRFHILYMSFSTQLISNQSRIETEF